MFFLFTSFNKYFIFSFFFSEKAFNVVGAEVLEQSGSKAVAGKKTGFVLHLLFVPCVWSELIIYIEYKTNQEPLLKLIFYHNCY